LRHDAEGGVGFITDEASATEKVCHMKRLLLIPLLLFVMALPGGVAQAPAAPKSQISAIWANNPGGGSLQIFLDAQHAQGHYTVLESVWLAADGTDWVPACGEFIDLRATGHNSAQAAPINLTVPSGMSKVKVSADLYQRGQKGPTFIFSVAPAVSDIPTATGTFTIWAAS
jgi:hypothetical protein